MCACACECACVRVREVEEGAVRGPDGRRTGAPPPHACCSLLPPELPLQPQPHPPPSTCGLPAPGAQALVSVGCGAAPSVRREKGAHAMLDTGAVLVDAATSPDRWGRRGGRGGGRGLGWVTRTKAKVTHRRTLARTPHAAPPIPLFPLPQPRNPRFRTCPAWNAPHPRSHTPQCPPP